MGGAHDAEVSLERRRHSRNVVMCGRRCRGSFPGAVGLRRLHYLGRIPKYELLFRDLVSILFPGIIRLACYYYQGVY
jgi:hypothetical protein